MPKLKKKSLQKPVSTNQDVSGNGNVVDEDSFYYFAVNHFTAGTAPFFTRADDAKQPVLASTAPADRKVALALWRTMLKFMGEITDLRHGLQHKSHMPNLGSVMSRLYRLHGIQAEDTTTKQTQDENGDDNGSADPSLKQLPTKPHGGTLRKLKATLTLHLAPKPRKTVFHGLPLEDTLVSQLDMVHYLIGNGLLRPSLRDELYCIVCKQLTDNPFKSSNTTGWLLLCLMAACFPPSQKILKYIMNYIASGPPIHATKIRRLLQNTIRTGGRFQPPSSLELQHAINKTPLELSITLMDGSSHSVPAEGTTTSHEICQKLKSTLGQKENFGFSVYIAMYGKVASLGRGNDKIMDAISQCEQCHRDQDGEEEQAPWRLFYRKEIFASWEKPDDDPVSTKLIYAQIVRGVLVGEYVCKDDDTLSTLAAKQYYVEYGEDISEDGVSTLLAAYIPETKRGTSTQDSYWAKCITEAHAKLIGNHKSLPPTDQIHKDIVLDARSRWSLEFSRQFDVIRLSDHDNAGSMMSLAVNAQGIQFVGEAFNKHVDFTQISTITCAKDGKHLLLVLLSGTSYKFYCLESSDIRALVVCLIDGLLARSRYAVALQDSGEGELQYQQGDLLWMKLPGAKGALREDKGEAKNIHTGKLGQVLSDNVHVLPTSTKPKEDVLKLFQHRPAHDQNANRVDAKVKHRKISPSIKSDNFSLNSSSSESDKLLRRQQSHAETEAEMLGMMGSVEEVCNTISSVSLDGSDSFSANGEQIEAEMTQHL